MGPDVRAAYPRHEHRGIIVRIGIRDDEPRFVAIAVPMPPTLPGAANVAWSSPKANGHSKITEEVENVESGLLDE